MKWPNAQEYQSIFQQPLPHPIYSNHPQFIYDHIPNQIYYFINKQSLKECLFPRIKSKKSIIWKKKNFITQIPRSQPIIQYIVSTSNRYIMHSIKLINDPRQLILCHIKPKLHQLTSLYLNLNQSTVFSHFNLQKITKMNQYILQEYQFNLSINDELSFFSKILQQLRNEQDIISITLTR